LLRLLRQHEAALRVLGSHPLLGLLLLHRGWIRLLRLHVALLGLLENRPLLGLHLHLRLMGWWLKRPLPSDW